MNLISNIIKSAQSLDKKIVLPEGEAERTLKAANIILQNHIASIILIGNKETILNEAIRLGLEYISHAEIIDPIDNPYKTDFINLLLEIRKNKGLTYNEAFVLAQQPLYIGPLLIKMGLADGEVSGAEHPTGDVLKPAFQIVKTAPNSSVVSGAFIMVLKDKSYGQDGILVFADCAVNPDPTAQQLAEIAIASADTAKKIAHIEPKVALLSFSTRGSAKHPLVDKVSEATFIAKKLRDDIDFEGEIQADAAIVEAIGQHKAPDSKIAGHANVLVFPNLDTGNISYKLVQRLAGAQAVGPVLQGMAAPINDLSRGCSVEDIVNLVAITANQAQ